MSTLPKLSQINTGINYMFDSFSAGIYNPLQRTDSNQAVVGQEDEENDGYNSLQRTDSDDSVAGWEGDRTRDIINDFPSNVSFATEVVTKTYELSSEEESLKKRWNVEHKTKTREGKTHMRWVKSISQSKYKGKHFPL